MSGLITKDDFRTELKNEIEGKANQSDLSNLEGIRIVVSDIEPSDTVFWLDISES